MSLQPSEGQRVRVRLEAQPAREDRHSLTPFKLFTTTRTPTAAEVRYWCTECSENPPDFENKRDWTRHDRTKHFQEEAWRCEMCDNFCYRDKYFREHLRVEHFIFDEETIDGHVRAFWIDRNGQRGFWCDFCEKIIKVLNRGIEAWDERSDHFAEHFESERVIDSCQDEPKEE